MSTGENPYVNSDRFGFPSSNWSNVMTKIMTRVLWSMTVAVFIAGAALLVSRPLPASSPAEEVKGGGPHYTVVETEGHNLVVTDNASNTLYFYTVDKGNPPGSELKLRGKVDLNQVGKPSIMPADVNIQK